MLTLETEWTAWQINEACALVGLQVEAAALRGQSSVSSHQSPAQGHRYASAASRVTKRMSIPKSGVW